jgi:multicomponent Na+:H+ antiporter subunit G
MISDFLALLGSLSFLIAALGLIRMPDSIARIHASTKASSLGVIFFSAAAAVKFPSPGPLFFSALILILVLLTAPMACQAIASRLLPPNKRGSQR